MNDKRAIRDGLIASYNLEELHTVCFDLEIDYDELPGESKSAKAIALIEHLWRRGRLDALVDYCRRDRPNYAWPAAESTEVDLRQPETVAGPTEINRSWQTEFGIRSLRAAVVWLTMMQGHISTAMQCGFLVDPRGYIISMDPTADDLTFSARWNRLDFPAILVARDTPSHSALFKIELSGSQLYNARIMPNNSNSAGDGDGVAAIDALFPAVSLSIEAPRVSDEVFLLGYNPDSGWINSPGRILQLDVSDDVAEVPVTLVDIETRIGFSGAPYMNWRGNVVGMHLGRRPDGSRMMIPARHGLQLIAGNL